MSKGLIIALAVATAGVLIYLFTRQSSPVSQASIGAASPSLPSLPTFAWKPNPITGVVGGNPVPLSTRIPVMNPGIAVSQAAAIAAAPPAYGIDVPSAVDVAGSVAPKLDTPTESPVNISDVDFGQVIYA